MKHFNILTKSFIIKVINDFVMLNIKTGDVDV